MATPDQWERAYVLHRRPYRNTSYILDILAEKSGRLCCVAQSARGQKSRFRGQLEPFTPLSICWKGRQELKTLTNAEVVGMPFTLEGMPLWSAFYLNELILRLLPVELTDACVFSCYERTLGAFQSGEIQSPIRYFELELLDNMGYALPLHQEENGAIIQNDKYYRYFPQSGFSSCMPAEDAYVYSGKLLLALAEKKTIPASLTKSAKQLLQLALSPHLGNKPLRSRELVSGLRNTSLSS